MPGAIRKATYSKHKSLLGVERKVDTPINPTPHTATSACMLILFFLFAQTMTIVPRTMYIYDHHFHDWRRSTNTLPHH